MPVSQAGRARRQPRPTLRTIRSSRRSRRRHRRRILRWGPRQSRPGRRLPRLRYFRRWIRHWIRHPTRLVTGRRSDLRRGRCCPAALGDAGDDDRDRAGSALNRRRLRAGFPLPGDEAHRHLGHPHPATPGAVGARPVIRDAVLAHPAPPDAVLARPAIRDAILARLAAPDLRVAGPGARSGRPDAFRRRSGLGRRDGGDSGACSPRADSGHAPDRIGSVPAGHRARPSNRRDAHPRASNHHPASGSRAHPADRGHDRPGETAGPDSGPDPDERAAGWTDRVREAAGPAARLLEAPRRQVEASASSSGRWALPNGGCHSCRTAALLRAAAGEHGVPSRIPT